MKKILITLLLLNLFYISYSQDLQDGVYTYESNTHYLTIFKTPEKIQIALVNKKERRQENGNAEMKVAPRYSDTPGKTWFEFQTDSCSYDFDIKKNMLYLNSFDCKNDKKDSKMVFLKKGFTNLAKWNQQVEQLKKKMNIM